MAVARGAALRTQAGLSRLRAATMTDRYEIGEGAEQPQSAGYEAGIDGLRGVAVTVVLLFHAQLTWLKGGFLGVSLFFTLSGFLITKLLLEEVERTQRVDFRRFLGRRVRRLAPASGVCLLFVAVFAPLFAASGQPVRLRDDLFAALGYVANWRFVASKQSYAELFLGGPSPVLHYWSLAIEEQFYLVYPVLLAGAAALGLRLRRSWVPAAVISSLAALSVLAAVLNTDQNLGYYGTHIRAAELLIGGVTAVALRRVGLRRIRVHPRWWSAFGTGAVVAFLFLTATVTQSTEWLSRGGFAALSVVWSLVIIGVLVPGPLRSLLSRWPLVHLGRISFSLYLFHWPIFLLLTPQRTGLSTWWLLTVRLVASLAVAAACYILVEHPIRTRRVRLSRWHGGLLFAGAAVAVVAFAVVQLPATPTSGFQRMVSAPNEVVTFGTDPVTTEVAAPIVTQPVVAVLGSDPSVLEAVQRHAATAGVSVVDLTDPGCSMLSSAPTCPSPSVRFSQYSSMGGAADVVVLGIGAADHSSVRQRIETATAISPDVLGAEFLQIDRDMGFVGALRAVVRHGTQINVVDSVPSAADGTDVVPHLLDAVPVELLDVAVLAVTDVQPAMLRSLTTRQARLKVMVIGDSTSYGVAAGLDDVAGDRKEVLWAGLRTCPIAAATELKWFEGAQWTMEDCLAAQARWPGVAAEFQPDVLLIVETLPEHSEQRYAGDSAWYVAGDERFTAEHDAAMERLLQTVEPYGTVTLIANSSYSGASPKDRVDAWNMLLGRWAQRWPSVSVIDLAGPVAAAEAAAGHSLRPDNIHLDDPTLLKMINEVFLPAIDGAISRSR